MSRRHRGDAQRPHAGRPVADRGRGDFDGAAIGYQISTGAVDEEGGLRIKASLLPDDYPLALDTEGTAKATNGALSYTGSFTLGADSAARPQLRGAPAAEVAQRRPSDYRLSGLFAFGHERYRHRRVSARNRAGGGSLHGRRQGKHRTRCRSALHDRGDGRTGPLRQAERRRDTRASTVALPDRLAALRRFLVGLPRPTIPGSVNVNLPAVVVGDTTIRSVRCRGTGE